MEDIPETKFASAERADQAAVKETNRFISEQEAFGEMLNLFPNIAFVLNENRQVVFSNDKLKKLLCADCVDDTLGKRPGEIVGCVHSDKEPGGCGTSEFCSQCGAVKAVLKAQHGEAAEEECRITVKGEKGTESLDWRVWATPLELKGKKFSVVTVQDINDEKRREALEKTFFHDILSEVGILAGYAENAKDGIIPKGHDPIQDLHQFSQRLAETICFQRDLIAAEKGELTLKFKDFLVKPFLVKLMESFRNSQHAVRKHLFLECQEEEASVRTDLTILNRVLGDMLKNALEASAMNDVVTVAYQKTEEGHRFEVHNQMVMPKEVQLQVFQRSFTTKGQGRGLGTYGVKLLVEKYLNGQVGFSSSPENGTIFFVCLP